MARFRSKLFIFALFFSVPIIATAAGYHATTFSVIPQNVPKVVSAIDTYFASSAGQQFKGRLILLSHVADGADPATHTLASLFHSVAELETFQNAVANDPAVRALMDAIVPVSTLQSTVRTRSLRSWGDLQDTDTVWVSHYFNVTDGPAFMAALDKWLASAAGKKFPGQGHLSAIAVGGMGAPSHVINVGYASQTEMAEYGDTVAASPEWATYLAEVAKAATYAGANMSQQVKAWGPASMKTLTP